MSGVNFSIGENGGTTATDLGIRTMTGSTLLSSLNLGQGVPVARDRQQRKSADARNHDHLRDGSLGRTSISAGATTVQDVLNDINAVQPGVLDGLAEFGGQRHLDHR